MIARHPHVAYNLHSRLSYLEIYLLSDFRLGFIAA